MSAGTIPIQNSALDHLAREVITSGAAPVAACEVRYRATDLWEGASGFATRERVPNFDAGILPVFDLASLTKPIFAIAVHRAIARCELGANESLGDLLPCVRGTRSAGATVETLLSHRSGLAAHAELFDVMRRRTLETKSHLLRTAANCVGPQAFSSARPKPPVYSDLGYILLGAAIESRFGVALEDWLVGATQELNIDELGAANQWLRRPPSSYRFVPTEVVPWRGGVLTGCVHDENAWLLSGHGLSGHAGLFGSARAVAEFGTAILDALAGRDSAIPRTVAIQATAKRPDGTLCAGFDRRAESASSAGCFCSQETFGHLGFTGTSLWCDPVRQSVTVLLTNRVCPSRANLGIRALRPRVHDALFAWPETRRG